MNYELRDWVGGMFESSVEAQCFVTQINNVTQILCVRIRSPYVCICLLN